MYRSGFGPLMGGVFVAPFPYLGRGPYAPPEKLMHNSESWEDSVLNMSFFGAASGSTARTDVARCLHAIELMLRTQTSPSETVRQRMYAYDEYTLLHSLCPRLDSPGLHFD